MFIGAVCEWGVVLYANAIMPAELHMTTRASAARSESCPKCGHAKKSGKPSCCARGGAWFHKCGDVVNNKFDHTWAEGIQACNGFVGSISADAPGPVRDKNNIEQPIKSTGLRNADEQASSIRPVVNVPDAGAVDCEDRVELAKFVVFAGLLFFNFYSHM